MSAQHTGGPWQSQHDFDLSGKYTIIGNVDGEIIGGHSYYHYTVVCEVYDNGNREEDAANARLIVKAPAMREVLREFLGDSLCGDREDGPDGEANFYRPVISWATRRRALAILAHIDGEVAA